MIVVIPMAGRGSRFTRSGYETPKPFIEVNGVPMFIRALQSLNGVNYDQLVFVVLNEHVSQYNLIETLSRYGYASAKIKCIDEITNGQMCTVLEAREYLQSGEDILIMASDSYISSHIQQDIAKKTSECRGMISVINLPGEQWSFARADESGNVIEVAEKSRISDYASTGIYYFADCQEFCDIADEMIKADERTRGEFYIIPVYQKLINRGGKVTLSIASEMWDMGTPEAKEKFETYLQENTQ
jgi:dTDP-glucose pyrophosphorylase